VPVTEGTLGGLIETAREELDTKGILRAQLFVNHVARFSCEWTTIIDRRDFGSGREDTGSDLNEGRLGP
jgi:hypothetical protein